MADTPDPPDATWLLARERGEPIDHIPADRRAAYDELGALLAKLPGRSPGPAWRARTLAALDDADRAAAGAAAPAGPALQPPPRRRPAWLRPQLWLCTGAIVVAAVLALILLWHRPAAAPGLAMAVDIISSDGAHRAGEAGGFTAWLRDTLVVRGTTPGPGELRVYRGDHELVLRHPLPGGPFEHSIVLGAAGEWHTALLLGAAIPAPTGLRTSDMRAWMSAGVDHRAGPRVRVY